MYKVIISTDEQELTDQIDSEQLEHPAPDILLNGEKMFLKVEYVFMRKAQSKGKLHIHWQMQNNY